jgi:hypothetical protein
MVVRKFFCISFLDRARGSGFETTPTRGLSIPTMVLLCPARCGRGNTISFQNSVFDKTGMVDSIQNIRETDCYTPSLDTAEFLWPFYF